MNFPNSLRDGEDMLHGLRRLAADDGTCRHFLWQLERTLDEFFVSEDRDAVAEALLRLYCMPDVKLDLTDDKQNVLRKMIDRLKCLTTDPNRPQDCRPS